MNNMKKILVIMILLLLITGCVSNNDKKVELKSIDKDLALEKIENGAILIDVRSKSEYQSGHIGGAINIDVNDILALDGELAYNNLNISKNRIIILYCRSGNRSMQAGNKLIELGYINVFDLGSMDNWS